MAEDPLASAHLRIHERIMSAAPVLERAVVPVVGHNKRQRREVVGSAVLVNFPPHFFLVTAEHVVTSLGPDPLCLALDGGLAKLTVDFLGARSSEVEKGADVAFAKLPNEFAVQFGRDRFLTRHGIAPNTAASPGRHALVIGYPSSKSKTNPQDGVLNYEAFRYASRTVSPRELAVAGYDPRVHLAIEFDKDESVLNVERARAPDPIGLSGAAMFGFQSLVAGDGAPNPLVGIVTTWRREQPHSLVATDFGVIAQGIFAMHPETDFRK